MMLNFDKYHLVEFLENPTLYEIQKQIISSSVLSQKNKVLKLALLLIQTPICDYETAITLLKDFSDIETDFEILVLGADLNAFLPVLGRSFFISKLKQLYAGKTEKDDAIISYLEAISLDNSASKKFSDVVYIDEKNEKIMYEKDFHIAESKYVNMLLDILKEKYL